MTLSAAIVSWNGDFHTVILSTRPCIRFPLYCYMFHCSRNFRDTFWFPHLDTRRSYSHILVLKVEKKSVYWKYFYNSVPQPTRTPGEGGGYDRGMGYSFRAWMLQKIADFTGAVLHQKVEVWGSILFNFLAIIMQTHACSFLLRLFNVSTYRLQCFLCQSVWKMKKF